MLTNDGVSEIRSLAGESDVRIALSRGSPKTMVSNCLSEHKSVP